MKGVLFAGILFLLTGCSPQAAGPVNVEAQERMFIACMQAVGEAKKAFISDQIRNCEISSRELARGYRPPKQEVTNVEGSSR